MHTQISSVDPIQSTFQQTCFQVCDILVIGVVLISRTADSWRKEDAQERDDVLIGRGRLGVLRLTVAANVRGFIRMRWR